MTGAIVAFFIFLNLSDRRDSLEIHPQGSIIAVIAGMLNFWGSAILYPISNGPVAIVSNLSAFYPLVVIALALVVLQETLTLFQAIGMGCTLVAIALIAT